MKPVRGDLLILLLPGLIWLVFVLPGLAQTPEATKARPEILQFSRQNCPDCQASERMVSAVKAQYPGQFGVR
jgi:hypothetical protein